MQSHRWDNSYKDLRVGTVITKPTAQITNSAVEICGHQKKHKRKLLEKKENRNLKVGVEHYTTFLEIASPDSL